MSKDTSDLADNNIAIGCNVILWDSFFVGLATWYILLEEITVVDIHPAFCIIGGFLSAGLFFVLTQIKYLNILVLLYSCIEYERFLATKIINFAQENVENFDNIWKWTIYIVLFILIAGWHIGSYAAFDIMVKRVNNNSSSDYSVKKSFDASTNPVIYNTTEDWDSFSKRYNTLQTRIADLLAEFKETLSSADAVSNLGIGDDYLKASIVTTTTALKHQYEEIHRLNEKIKNENLDYAKSQYIIDDIEEHYTVLQHLLHQLMKEIQSSLTNYRDYQTATQRSSAGCDESLFHGCEDKESLTKRYKSLLKIYHPDNSNGDLSMTQKIQYTYEKLLNQYS